VHLRLPGYPFVMETRDGRSSFAGVARRAHYTAAESEPRVAASRSPAERSPGASEETGGRILGGRYELTGIIGHGGMGTVWRAKDLALGRAVAVKVLAPHLAADPRVLARFVREAHAAAALAHANVVTVFDTGADAGEHYIVMELVDGESLAERLRREGPLRVDEALSITSQVLKGLQAAHDRALVHSDVTPCNIMLPKKGGAKLVDFGIARAIDDGSPAQTRSLLGTVAYLSPEQAAARPLDPRSDLYALGCVLFEMLTGRPPFASGTPLSIAAAHVHRRPDPPSTLQPGLSPAVDALVLRALSKDREERHSSADAMAGAVRAVLRDLPKEPFDDSGTPKPATPLRAGASALPERGDEAPGAREPLSSLPTVRESQTVGDPASALPRPKARSGRRRALIVGLVIAALIGFGLIALALALGDEPQSAAPPSDRSSTVDPTPMPTASPGATPAPAGAQEAATVTAPSRDAPPAAWQRAGDVEKADEPEKTRRDSAADRATQAGRSGSAGSGRD
jgi:eukaryotic-like serine/threonine-protein kinase